MNNNGKDIKSKLILKHDVESMRTFLATQRVLVKSKFIDDAKKRIMENAKKLLIKYSNFDN